MILSGLKIRDEALAGNISISPFSEKNVTTNSYDLTIGSTVLRIRDEIIDPKREVQTEELEIPETGLVMQAGEFLLGCSEQIIGSEKYVPIIHAKSSIARLGLFVHVTADLIDIGSIGQVTFQLFATQNVTLYPGMEIGQVSFWVPRGEIRLYTGKYQGSKGPQPSKVYKDFQAS
ncbi:dCTP deaminase [Burkholderia lata]|uniref:dCTP deaminase n=1 Tax=Burkholderia lata (strain ATCC 17760 / DSM 23089 / LMG 22485 / NCIMB 9086 / R18194 / 383) TaxID=482957 RepID=A0A6P2NVS1_BURL3|nr:dCTP deaminase [Burkholderia lata]VWB98968.1 dCTP deaminase [Burkholderia lata]